MKNNQNNPNNQNKVSRVIEESSADVEMKPAVQEETAKSAPQTDDQIAELKQIIKQLEEEKSLQTRMLLKSIQTKKNDPFSHGTDAKDYHLIEKIHELREKHKREGVTRREGIELHRLMNEVLDVRENVFDLKEASLDYDDQQIPKTFEENRTLHVDGLAPGFEYRFEYDNEELDGSKIRTLMNMGFLPVRTNNRLKVESDGQVKTPNFKDSGIVTRHAGPYGRKGLPTKAILMARAACFGEEAQRQRQMAKRKQLKGAMNRSLNELNAIAKQLAARSGAPVLLDDPGVRIY